MLNVFPELLYPFFAPLLLRVAAAIMFAYIAWMQIKRKEEIAAMRFPIIGGGEWIVWICAVFNVLVGAALLFGYYTQVAAMLAAISLIKSFALKSRYPRIMPLSRSGIVLLCVICVSLIISGAGALAQDLPL